MPGLVDRISLALFGDAGARGPTDDFWYQSSPWGRSEAGVTITPDTALQISTVYACTRVISETIASLPWITYRRTGDGKERAREHPYYRLLHTRPNATMTPFEVKELLLAWTVLRGRAIAEIVPDPVTGNPAGQLMPIHPDRWRREMTEGGRWRYQVRDADYRGRVSSEERPVDQDWVLCVTGPMGGHSVVSYARNSFGRARAIEKFGSKFFANGAKPSGVAQVPKGLSAEAHQRLKADLEAATTGDRSNSILVFEDGMTWSQVSLSNEDSQFLETEKHSQAVIAGEWFRIPLHKVGNLEKATFSNIEHQALEWISDCLMPWAERLEQAAQVALFDGFGDEYFSEILLDQLLRGDTKTRYEAYNLGINGGWLSRNEARDRENLNRIDGLDSMLEPLNMAPAGSRSEETTGPEQQPAGSASQARLIVRRVAGGLVKQEQAAILKAARAHPGDRQRFEDAVEEFYDGFAARVSEVLYVGEADARLYCDRHRTQVAVEGLQATESWDAAADQLTRLALAEAERRPERRGELVRSVERDADG